MAQFGSLPVNFGSLLCAVPYPLAAWLQHGWQTSGHEGARRSAGGLELQLEGSEAHISAQASRVGGAKRATKGCASTSAYGPSGGPSDLWRRPTVHRRGSEVSTVTRSPTTLFEEDMREPNARGRSPSRFHWRPVVRTHSHRPPSGISPHVPSSICRFRSM